MKRIVIGLAAAVFLATSTAMADAPGRGLFDAIFGSGSGVQEECPGGQCPVEWSSEQVAKPPTIAVHVNGASGVIVAMSGRDVAVLTAYHVVEGQSSTNIQVVLPDGTKGKGTICLKHDGSHAVDKAADIALVGVRAQKEVKPFCSLAYEQPKVGDPVTTCGYGPNDVYRTIPGEVVEFTEQSYDKRPCPPDSIMVVSGEAQAGDSGGPIFGPDGRVCGIVSRSTRDRVMPPDRTWSTSLNRIAALCADTKFPFPWRKEVEKELEEARQLPVPYPQAPPAGLSVKAEARISAMEARIEAIVNEYGPRFERVEGVAEAAVTAAENASTDAGKQFADDVAALKQLTSEADTSATLALRTANDAADIAATADLGFTEASIRLAEAGEERSKLGTIIDGVREKVAIPRKAAAWTVGKIATVTGIPVAGVVIVGLGICVVLWRRKVKPMVAADIAAYRETGDDTFLQGAAERIPGRLGSAISIAVDRAVERHLGPAGGGAEPEAAPAKKARRTS